MKKNICFVLVGLVLFGVTLVANASVPQRDANYAVTDLAHLFNESTVNYLVEQNDLLFETNGAEVVFLTVDEIPDEQSIEAFSLEVFNAWGVGSVENNNGVLIVMANLDGDAFINVGGGLEAHLSNSYLNNLMDTYFIPHFAVGDDDLAAMQIFDALSSRLYDLFPAEGNLEQSVTPEENITVQEGGGLMNFLTNNFVLILIVLLVLFLLAGAARRPFGGGMHDGMRRRGFLGRRRRGGGFGHFAGGFMFGNMMGRRNNNRNRSSHSQSTSTSRSTSNTTYTRNKPTASTNRGAKVSVNPVSRSQHRTATGRSSRSGGYRRGGSSRGRR